MSNFSKVGTFMKTFGQEVKTEPSFSSDKINKDMICKALIKYDYDLNQVAKALGMSRTTLWRYRKKFNL